jgi:hypothetical protein
VAGLAAIGTAANLGAIVRANDTRAEVAYQTYLSGDGNRLSVLFHTLRSDRLGDAGRIESDTQRIVFAPDFRTAQAEHRAELARSLPLSTTTPDWVREMNAWFARHEVDRRPGWDKAGEESPGFVAHLLWGGTPANPCQDGSPCDTEGSCAALHTRYNFATDPKVQEKAKAIVLTAALRVGHGSLTKDVAFLQAVDELHQKFGEKAIQRGSIAKNYHHWKG